MGWMGKILGGGIGAVIGGPIGAIIGASLGHAVVDSRKAGASPLFGKPPPEEDVLSASYFACFFTCLGKMAKADGRVTQDEVETINQIIDTKMHLPREDRIVAVEIFRAGRDTPRATAEFLTQFNDLAGSNPQLREFFLWSLFAVALADKNLHPAEKSILIEAERILQQPAGTVEAWLRNEQADTGGLDEAYQLLDGSPSMSMDEIKSRYRKKCLEFHPDKIQAKGLPMEFMDFANQQLTKINRAYELIRKNRA